MKIHEKKSSRKKIFTAIIILLLILGAAFAVYYVTRPAHYSTAGDSSKKDTSNRTTSLDPSKETAPSTSDTKTPSQPTNSGSTVTPSSIPQPALNAPYPIQTEHYEIKQLGDTTLSITLYGILNSPSQYQDYMSQLKQYKQEVLSYLQARYGSTVGTLSLSWSPKEAQNL